MNIPGWTRTQSPFHEGELAIQDRIGVRERMDKQGRRVIREFMPDQHRQFFAGLSYVIVGTLDKNAHPWASILVGNPGFLSSPDDRTLRVKAQPLFGDPLGTNLAEGIDIGLLGIELSTRRRNRLNGRVKAIDTDGFDIEIRQSFGNCPQYIQARGFQLQDFEASTQKPIYSLQRFSEEERKLISGADTFFIATAYQFAEEDLASGVDVSHRGGKPGFIRIDDESTLTIPDFSGNNHFNTFGNLELNPRAGLLLIDFRQGDLLYLTGTAQVIWEGEEIRLYPGAERLLRFYLHQGYRVEGSLPLCWSSPEFSPFLESFGSW